VILTLKPIFSVHKKVDTVSIYALPDFSIANRLLFVLESLEPSVFWQVFLVSLFLPHFYIETFFRMGRGGQRISSQQYP